MRALAAAIEEELGRRIGPRLERSLHAALAKDWGEPPVIEPEDLQRSAAAGS